MFIKSISENAKKINEIKYNESIKKSCLTNLKIYQYILYRSLNKNLQVTRDRSLNEIKIKAFFAYFMACVLTLARVAAKVTLSSFIFTVIPSSNSRQYSLIAMCSSSAPPINRISSSRDSSIGSQKVITYQMHQKSSAS